MLEKKRFGSDSQDPLQLNWFGSNSTIQILHKVRTMAIMLIYVIKVKLILITDSY